MIVPLLLAAALTQTSPAATPAKPAPATDWAGALRNDARALHETIAINHPGPVNRLDPGFAERNDAGLALALGRAATVRDYPGYLWAMRAYVAGFDDGHVAFSITDQSVPLPTRWPGFLTGFDERGRQTVMTREDDAPVPLGAELASCDGIPAERLAARLVGAFYGRWMLASQRAWAGGRVFVHAGNPYVTRPRRCRFIVDGRARDVALEWRPLSDAALAERLGATTRRATPPIGARALADGTRWFSLSNFNSDPNGPAAKALVPLIAAMKRDRHAIAAAPRIVLDLRGNNGGSSDWSRQIAEVLWDKAAVAALPTGSTGVEWRASAANLATIEAVRTQFAGADAASPEMKQWAERTASGLRSTLAAGRPLWSDEEAPDAPSASPSAPTVPPTARVYVLTDLGCGSACLDAVDLWRALGAVQIGQETSADTLYMDVRRDALPSGIARVVVPMKVYRGRKRGSNVPWVPVHRYAGDMRDTPALERWVAKLP